MAALDPPLCLNRRSQEKKMPKSPKAKKTSPFKTVKSKAKPSVAARASLTKASPTYADVTAMLDTLVPKSDQNINDAPHAAFWRTLNRNDFVAKDVSDWSGGQVKGPLVTPGNPDTSPFYLALAGKPPFDGSVLPQMPDVSQDPNANPATPDNLALVSAWIKNGAPA
jgi:hypothetical protein